MKVLFRRNTTKVRWRITRLPVRQTLIWLGPVFILLQPKRQS